jgi:ubiquinone/menaquinone biosynthesis C-methylase UbiE
MCGSRRSNPATDSGLLDPIRTAVANANGVKQGARRSTVEMAGPAARETYTHDVGAEFTRLHGGRTAARDAAFFLPHLRPGLRLLDCGCGPGSITIGLAEVVAAGEVVAVDIAEAQLAAARALASERGVGNIRFQLGSIYELPLPDASVDAAFAHNVLEHLRAPEAALAELHRVLRPGGVVGIRDDDWGAYLLEPTSALLRLGVELVLQVVEHNGGNFRSARHHVRRLREAGFVDVAGYASAGGSGTTEPVAEFADVFVRQLRDPAFAAVVLGEGWADAATIEAIAADFHSWADSPDAFLAFVKCAAVGRRPAG